MGRILGDLSMNYSTVLYILVVVDRVICLFAALLTLAYLHVLSKLTRNVIVLF